VGKNPHIEANERLGQAMWRFIKALLFLFILAGVGLVAYAYIGPLFFPGDFAAPTQEVTQPVTLETN
jgi:predicted small lipoprotein YifL